MISIARVSYTQDHGLTVEAAVFLDLIAQLPWRRQQKDAAHWAKLADMLDTNNSGGFVAVRPRLSGSGCRALGA